MNTDHRIIFSDARSMDAVATASVDLVVTSPPYPMIAMWDDAFTRQDPGIGDALKKGDAAVAFERMHRLLDPVWAEVHRILKPGAMACVNIGDAVRTVGDTFRLFPNHSRILAAMRGAGLNALPAILWRKPTNAPNKFMGSGMLPAGAYVTLEHEYILIWRKGGKRRFTSTGDKALRRESAYFWEERNRWFSDVWMDVTGTGQSLGASAGRRRSAAFPFEMPYRLINMFSVKGDLVVDPFLGTGSTLLAAMAAGRNSIGYETAPDLRPVIDGRFDGALERLNAGILQRLEAHAAFADRNGNMRYRNRHYGFPVKTRQEQDLLLNPLVSVERTAPDRIAVTYGRHLLWQPPMPAAR